MAFFSQLLYLIYIMYNGFAEVNIATFFYFFIYLFYFFRANYEITLNNCDAAVNFTMTTYYATFYAIIKKLI